MHVTEIYGIKIRYSYIVSSGIKSEEQKEAVNRIKLHYKHCNCNTLGITRRHYYFFKMRAHALFATYLELIIEMKIAFKITDFKSHQSSLMINKI